MMNAAAIRAKLDGWSERRDFALIGTLHRQVGVPALPARPRELRAGALDRTFANGPVAPASCLR
jgi:hypothetical protein